MKLFKEDYSALFNETLPSPALNEETVALMAEAQAHPLPKAAAKPKKKWILPTAISAAAAMVAIGVGIGLWLNTPPAIIQEEKGDLDTVLPGISPNFDTNSGDAGFDSAAPLPEAGGNNAATDGENNQATPEQGDDAAQEQTPSDENLYDGSASENPPTVDPRLPVVINTRDTKTYLSYAEFVKAIARGETPGFGTNYRTKSDLLTIPTFLPQNTRFRQLYIHSNGSYELSYLVQKDGIEYLLNIRMDATMPKTLRDIQLRQNAIKTGETIDFDAKPTERIYYVGRYDVAHVSATPVLGGDPLNQEQLTALLSPFDLGRYSAQSPFLEMTYEK